jgi:hypothetical protein
MNQEQILDLCRSVGGPWLKNVARIPMNAWTELYRVRSPEGVEGVFGVTKYRKLKIGLIVTVVSDQCATLNNFYIWRKNSTVKMPPDVKLDSTQLQEIGNNRDTLLALIENQDPLSAALLD